MCRREYLISRIFKLLVVFKESLVSPRMAVLHKCLRCLPYRESKIEIIEERQVPQLWVSILGRYQPYRELKEMTDERQGPTLDVFFAAVSALLIDKKSN